MKDKPGGKNIVVFVELKPKIYSMENIDGRESDTAKEVNITTEFLFLKKEINSLKIVWIAPIYNTTHK